MQPRLQEIQNATENEQVTEQRKAAVDLRLMQLPTPYFHPSLFLNPLETLPPEQDPFKHINFDSKQQALSVSQLAPLSTTSTRFEPAMPTDVSQSSSQLKRKLQPQKITITDPFSRSMPQYGTINFAHSNHSSHSVNVPPQQVAFEPDPVTHPFKKPYAIKQSAVTAKPLPMFFPLQNASGMSANMRSTQSALVLQPQKSKKDAKKTKKDTRYYFLDGNLYEGSSDTILNYRKYSYVNIDKRIRLLYKSDSLSMVGLYL